MKMKAAVNRLVREVKAVLLFFVCALRISEAVYDAECFLLEVEKGCVLDARRERFKVKG